MQSITKMKEQNKGETPMQSLADSLVKEQMRVREILCAYREVGPAGKFAATMIELDLQAADRAIMSGDVVEMIKAYKTLKDIDY